MKRWGEAFYDDALSGAEVLEQVQIAVVVFGILGMCYWEIFGKF